MGVMLSHVQNWAGIVGGILLFALFCVAMITKWQKRGAVKDSKRLHSAPNQQPDETGNTFCQIKASVVEQVCGVRMVGSKTPKTVKEFLVVFKTENGEILKFNVPEEMYDGFEKGQSGTLTMADGELYGFALDGDEENCQ